MENIVVVGGGIAGLISALVLRKEHRVTLIEKAEACGGLMRTFVNAGRVPFDFGTHFLGETGSDELDSLLYDRIDNPAWNRFKIVRAGNFFGGRLYRDSPHIDARTLPAPLYERAARELLATETFDPGETTSLEEFLTRRFGPTLTRHVHLPTMRKIFGCELTDLLPDNPFVLKRVICFDAQRSRELKESPFMDDKLAYHTNEEGAAMACWHFYPGKGCVGQWTEDICADLVRSGVRVATGRSVKRVLQDGRLQGVELDDGERLDCSHLVWTVAPALLLKAMGVPIHGPAFRPRPTGLFHFVFDRNFLVDNHYILCYDEALRSFRVTLFPNLNERAEGPYNCTVEVIGEGADPKFERDIREELTTMGLVSKDARLISSDFDLVPQGFPTLTRGFVETARAYIEKARHVSKDVTLLGRAKFDAFTIEPVALDAFQQSKELLALKASA